jgi:hypothetical protein
MATNLTKLKRLCQKCTSAKVTITTLSPAQISVSVVWPETEGDDGDHCHGQNTILKEAYRVLEVLEGLGWRHCEFGGRKDFGHGGGTTRFACEKL